ncbi:hypothetical protein Q8F55_005322 [Vanrija albida]|uniref:phosphatidylserine decarboxylase n=1 Tax=Vanrija albida TaxID=181172 RepID=A0ABR3Q1A7_9TREE
MSSNPGATFAIDPTLGTPLADSLTHIVASSAGPAGAAQADELAPSEKRIDAVHAHGGQARAWVAHFFPSAETLDRLFAYEHMGNFVIDRMTGRKLFESMPLYVRVGMHLLFVEGSEYMSYKRVEKLLTDQSVKQGRIYDETGPSVRPHIESFVTSYAIPLDELLVQDLDQYPTFNSFFARRLVATARPITAAADPGVLTSPADCRIGVFQTLEEATSLWIKGKKFTVPALLTGDEADSRFDPLTASGKASVVVCRLAPQDYHRFHAPFDGEIVAVKDIAGDLYTVNPQAINEDLNVFTLNKRSAALVHANLGPGREATPAAFVAIGAMLVGSIGWSKKPGDKFVKGEELGWFQYGGSTTIVVLPEGVVQFDDDLVQTSKNRMETLVRVGMEIGKVVPV